MGHLQEHDGMNEASGRRGSKDEDNSHTKQGGRASTASLLPVHVVLLLMQLGFAGHQVLSRVALTSGLSQFVYAIYRNGIALVLMAPFAYFFERKDRPPITGKLLFRFFLLGITGIVGSQQLFLAGLIYTSATFAATMQNAVPVITFLLAWILGLEEVQLKRLDGMAKLAGTMVSVLGALLMSAYQGPAVIQGWSQESPDSQEGSGMTAILGHSLGSQADRLGFGQYQLGGLLLLINCFSWATYLIMQAPILKICPTPLTITAFTYLFGTLQVMFLMLVFTGGAISWSLSRGPQVYSVIYAGVISSGINFTLQSWAIQKGGPLLVSLYTPVQTVIVAALSVLLLGDSLYLGICIGGLGEVAGLYLVTWGQVQHRKQEARDAAAEGSVGRDEESAPIIPQTGNAITQPLLAAEETQQRDHQPGLAAERARLSLPRRTSSFTDDVSANMSPHLPQ